MVNDSTDKAKFPHKLLSTDKLQRFAKLLQMFHQLKRLSKAQLYKMVQLGGGFLSSLLSVMTLPIKLADLLMTPVLESYGKELKKFPDQ